MSQPAGGADIRDMKCTSRGSLPSLAHLRKHPDTVYPSSSLPPISLYWLLNRCIRPCAMPEGTCCSCRCSLPVPGLRALEFSLWVSVWGCWRSCFQEWKAKSRQRVQSFRIMCPCDLAMQPHEVEACCFSLFSAPSSTADQIILRRKSISPVMVP